MGLKKKYTHDMITEERALEEKRAFARRLIARGKQTLEVPVLKLFYYET